MVPDTNNNNNDHKKAVIFEITALIFIDKDLRSENCTKRSQDHYSYQHI